MTKYRNNITYDAVAELLRYDPDAGKLYWKTQMGRRGKVGEEAGCLDKSKGYVYIGIGGLKYRAHRLAWLLTYGEMPEDQIDHINGDKADNRIENLRSLTHQENLRAFHKPRVGVSSKYRGVSWHKRIGKWQVRVKIDGKENNEGYFECELEAARAYDKKAEELGYAEEALNRTHHPEVGD